MDPYDELDSAVIHERQNEMDDALAHYRAAEALAGDDSWLLSEVLRRQAYVHHSRSEWERSLALARRAATTAAAAELKDQHAEALIAIAWVHVAREVMMRRSPNSRGSRRSPWISALLDSRCTISAQ
ncbi:MAG: hypothetical protein ABI884_08190 [Gemmatimonadota bacterium]